MTSPTLLQRPLYLITGSLAEAAQVKAEYRWTHPRLKVLTVTDAGDLPDFPTHACIFEGSVSKHLRRALRLRAALDDTLRLDIEYSLSKFSSILSACGEEPADLTVDLTLRTRYHVTERQPGRPLPDQAAFSVAVQQAVGEMLERLQTSGELAAAIERHLGDAVGVTQERGSVQVT